MVNIDTLTADLIPSFTWLCFSFKEAPEVFPEAGFNSEGDVAEYVRAVEMSEGYTPVVFEWDSEEDLYYKTDKFNDL